MNKLAILAVGAAFAAPAAFAGGLNQPVAEPAVAPAPAPYVAPAVDGEWGGAYAGLQLGYGKASTSGIDGDGVIGGVHAGYRWDFGKAVLGAELSYDAADLKDDTYDAKLKDIARLKLLAGYDLGRTLIYATAGAAHAKASVAGDSYSDSGWFAGVGVDYAINDQWTVGGEALFNKFDDFDGTGYDVDAKTIAVKASYRF